MKMAWCDKVGLTLWCISTALLWAGDHFDPAWLGQNTEMLWRTLLILWVPLRVLDLIWGGPARRARYSGGINSGNDLPNNRLR